MTSCHPAGDTRFMLKNVAVVVLDRIEAFELGVVCEVFGIDRSDDGLPTYDFAVVAGEPGPIRCNAGFTISTPYGLDRLEEADRIAVPAVYDRRPGQAERIPGLAPPENGPASLVPGAGLVPGGMENSRMEYSGAESGRVPARLLAALRRAADRGAWVLSVCSGVFVLGDAGLLEGRRCPTHWRHSDELARRYPSAQVDPHVLYVDEQPVITSAGTAAGIDACLHLVRKEQGSRVANGIARRMVVPPHRDGGQAQYVDRPVAVPKCDTLAGVLGWMQRHLGQQVTVRQLAARARMSPRTFARRFVQETGTTPLRWLTGQRILLAQEMLEETDETVDLIAERAGFGNATALRHHFRLWRQTTPHAYRHAFRPAAMESAAS